VRHLLNMNLVLIDNAAVRTHSFVETENYADLACMHQAMSARETKFDGANIMQPECAASA